MDEIIKQLPPLEIPPLNLPFEIPALVHPAIVHFAIAIPVIVLFIEIFNTFSKKRPLSVTSLLMLMTLIVITLGAALSGMEDGKLASESLTSDAMATLKEHKMLGIYLVYASGVLLIFKMLSMLFNAGFIRFLFLLVLIGYTGISLYQGKEGGELVYKHGANVAKAVELDNKLFDLEDSIDDIKSKSAQTIKALEANLTTLQSALPDTKTIEEEKTKLNDMIEALTNEKSAVLKELNELKFKASSESSKIKEVQTQALEQSNKLQEQIKLLEAQKAKAQAEIEKLTKALEDAQKTPLTPTIEESNATDNTPLSGRTRGLRG